MCSIMADISLPLTISCILLKNGQAYFTNPAALTLQDF